MAVVTCPHCGIDVEIGDGGVRIGYSESSGTGRSWRWEGSRGEVVHRCTESASESESAA